MFSKFFSKNETIVSTSQMISRCAKNRDIDSLKELVQHNSQLILTTLSLEQAYQAVSIQHEEPINANKYTHEKYSFTASIIHATKELAKEGDLESIYFLKEHLNIDMKIAVYGFAFGYHTKIVNQLIAQDADRESAKQGYIAAGHLNGYKSFNTISLTDDVILREMLVKYYLESITELLRKNTISLEEFFQDTHRLSSLQCRRK